MNVRNGFYRLWIVCSWLLLAFVVVFSYGENYTPAHKKARHDFMVNVMADALQHRGSYRDTAKLKGPTGTHTITLTSRTRAEIVADVEKTVAGHEFTQIREKETVALKLIQGELLNGVDFSDSIKKYKNARFYARAAVIGQYTLITGAAAIGVLIVGWLFFWAFAGFRKSV